MEGSIHTQKRGFTLIEIMVVMSIMALMSVLGLAAIVNVNNSVIADQISEGILSQIRETQNKAFSVADATDGSGLIPVAWAVKANSTNGLVTNLYIEQLPDKSYKVVAVGDDYKDYPYQVDDVTVTSASGSSSSVASSVWLVYSTPFAAYHEVNGSVVDTTAGPGNPCSDTPTVTSDLCSQDPNPPKSLIIKSETGIDVDNKAVKITISFRHNQRTITIDSNGEANISG